MIYLGNRNLSHARETLAIYQRAARERLAAHEPLYIQIDPHLGWRLHPSSRHPVWPYTTDRYGNRSSHIEGTILPSAYRIAIAGNSYVHCDEAPDDETWVWLLQDNLGKDYRIHNLGVTAYSTDQAFLRLKEFSTEVPVDMAVLTLTTTDVYRNLNMCRAFIMNDFKVPLYKPRFVQHGAGIELKLPPRTTIDTLTDPLSDRETLGYLRANDSFFPTAQRQACQILRRFRVPVRDIWQRNFDDGIAMTLQICRHFIDWCRERRTVPVLLLLPVYWGSFPAGREFDIIAAEFASSGTFVIDAREVFTPERLRMPRASLAYRFNHFTRDVSAWLAEHIGKGVRAAAKSAKGA